MKKRYIFLPACMALLIIIFMLPGLTFAQAKKEAVRGLVQTEKGMPLAGVSVTVEEKKKKFSVSTQTDSKGIFTFRMLEKGGNYQFTFSHMGYEKQVMEGYTYNENDVITLSITLQPSSDNLDEVVIVGYGAQKKVNLTGAVSQVDSKAFTDKPVANVSQALQGVVPNLNITFPDGHPGSVGKFNIRGTNSNNANVTPLVLIDGVPSNIAMVNPHDIASVSVLKDAASAAIYGARGAYGVILITTKQGKKGKMVVNYSGNYGIQKNTSRTDFITDGYTHAKLVDDAFSRRNGTSYTGYNSDDYAELQKRLTDRSLPSVVVQNRNGKDQYVYYGNTDWWNYLFTKSQPSMEHSLSLSGGSDKVDFVLSGRYFQQKGMYNQNQDVHNAYNFRAKVNAKITPWLTVYSNTQFAATDYTFPGWSYSGNYYNISLHALSSYVPENPDGTFTYRTNLNNYEIGNGILADLQHGKTHGGSRNYEFTNTVGFNLNVLKGLSVTGNYTYNLQPYSTYQRRTQIPWSIFPGVISYLGNDYLTESSNLDQHHTVNLYANYDKTFNKHHIGVTAGMNQELQKYKANTATRQGLLSEDLNQLDLGTGAQTVGGNANEWALLGFFGRINYDYAGKYLLELNGRSDGSSRFPKNNRFGFFPSVSGGWRISEEAFFQPAKRIASDVKLRASYGVLGNQDPGTAANSATIYPAIPVMTSGLSKWIINNNQTQYLSAPVPVTPNLTWEKSATVDLGIDASFLRSRLQVSYDWYRRKTTDMLINGKTLPAVFGASSPRQNAGDLLTKGFDLSVSWRDRGTLAGKEFSYNIGVVLSDYTASITKFDNPTNLLSNGYVGQQFGEIWGYSVDGLFASDADAKAYNVDQSFVNKLIVTAPGTWAGVHGGDMKFKDLDGNKIINNGQNTLDDPGDMRRIGNSLPRYSYGINASFSWNNIDVSVFAQGIGRQHWYPGSEAGKFWGAFGRPYYSFIPKDFEQDIWSPENPNAYFPLLRGYEALNDGGELKTVNDRYLQNIAYLRIKNITVGYNMPMEVIRHLKMQKLRIYFSGQNLFTFTKMRTKYIDPEQVTPDAMDTHGHTYPFFKTYSFGLDITF